jgi:hypothetical protein
MPENKEALKIAQEWVEKAEWLPYGHSMLSHDGG